MVILVKTDWRTLKRSNGDNGNIFVLLFPVNCETTVFLGTLSVTVLSITKDIFVYHAITIRCKRRVKNCKFQFDISDS